MLCNAWGQRTAQACEMRQALKQSAKKIDEQIDLLLGRIVESTSTATVAAYERKIEQLEKERLLLAEKLEKQTHPKATSEQMLELCLTFLASPRKNMGFRRSNLEENSAEIGVCEPLAYSRNNGYRTSKTTLLFKVLGDICTPDRKMARLDGDSSNELFDTLTEWNTALEHLRSKDSPVPPCP